MRREEWKGMGTFTAIWSGQLLSMLGTGMSQFAVMYWVWGQTHQVTTMTIAGICGFTPVILLSPLAGAIVDRANRKLLMILSDLAAGLGTLTILLLYVSGVLEIWHLYAVVACIGAFGAFQFPAYSATISVLVDKKQYARASGMMSLAGSVSGVFGPIAAGILLAPIGIPGILCVDLVTMTTAIVILLFARIPQPAASAEGAKARGSLFREAGFGFRYIAARRGLLGLLCMFFLFNVTTSFGFTVLAPMVLARTHDNAVLLGSVQSAAGIGGVVGAVFLSLWGGPRRRVHGVLTGCALGGLIGLAGVGLGQSLPVWAGAMFAMSLIFPTVNASSQTIWQSKVPPDLQGRVFSVRLMLAQMGTPLAMVLAGPLADRVFEPGMQPGGGLAGTFGSLVGTGPGAGMALMLVFAGLLAAGAAFVGYAYRPLRVVESALPDHDVIAAEEAEPAVAGSRS